VTFKSRLSPTRNRQQLFKAIVVRAPILPFISADLASMRYDVMPPTRHHRNRLHHPVTGALSVARIDVNVL
jgi:hypothetical protein